MKKIIISHYFMEWIALLYLKKHLTKKKKKTKKPSSISCRLQAYYFTFFIHSLQCSQELHWFFSFYPVHVLAYFDLFLQTGTVLSSALCSHKEHSFRVLSIQEKFLLHANFSENSS